MKKSIILIISIIYISGLHAQSKWTLRQCIDYATENNIDIRQKEIDVKNEEVNVSTIKNSRLPDLSASASQNFNFGRALSQSTNTFESSSMSSTSFGVSTSIPVFTGFRIPNETKVKELNLKAAIESLNKAKDNIQLNVTSYFLDVLFKKEILKMYEDQVALSKLQVERTEILTSSGKVPLSQLYDVKAQLAKDELNVTTSSNDLALSLLNLAQALNMRDAEGFDIQSPSLDNIIVDNISSIMPIDQVYQTSLSIKPVIKEAEFRLQSSQRNLKVAQSGFWPTLSLGASYNNGFDHVYNSDNAGPATQLGRNGREAIGLTLNIPLFNRFQTRNQVRTARLDIEYRRLALDDIKLSLYKEIQQAYQSAVAAESKYTSSEKAFEAANVSFNYAQERYNVGKSTAFEFQEVTTRLLTTKSDQLQAKYDFLFRAKILDFYNGKEIDIQ